MSSFDGVLLASVPEHEIPLARKRLPGAVVTAERLSPALARAHPNTRVLSVTIYDAVTPEALEALRDLRAVVSRSTGFEHLPADWLRTHGIPGCNLADYASDSVAQHAVALVLALLRRVPEGLARTRADPPSWDRAGLGGRYLGDVTVGVLGTGRIGSRVVRALSALGGTVVGHDVAPDPALEKAERFSYVRSLEDLAHASDVLTVHVPLDAATRALIDARVLELLPDGACLVNTARGPIVDQGAVDRALASGRLAGYAADVLPGEPDPPDVRRFARAPNALLTPHLAAHDAHAIRLRWKHTADAARAALDGDTARLARYRVV